ncbi:tetratricopeptide repeat protein [Panacibacter ginsenosidivorans]|uniref:Tetratricopeptide repeat protein n=1 Tax=Panacibacter ginsenosidivorans TaxID=1813871 RepID=A0A5B8V803_9BACT|nr:tetratricopeptide repeat protein [Panacibacter ginsenosidivorans]QEC66951.1 tetratricopeptide repeat protein [Panacibacter ginsenosidivorans]
MRKSLLNIFLTVFLAIISLTVFSQPGTTVELDKPKQYENRTLSSEKSDQKKFKYPKRVYQNGITHYNYYFNAENKLNEILDGAKKSFKDDYTKLLPFYNYTLDVTATSGELDSVIYKCNAGILLHDLRNDWIDNLYLLLGEAYFYRKNFDSANAVFRYINYAWAPKEEGGYDIPVGSNVSGNGVFSVATKENNSLVQKVFATPPSRNESLLWQARNDMETDNFGEAGGILEILQHDPVFPARLQPALHELVAYWNYKQGIADSSAAHLIKALEAAGSNLEKARMEFLIAQLYEKTDSIEKAIAWYSKSAAHTTDPVMEVYANLNSIKASGSKDENVLKEKLDNLQKMAKRDKYYGYRDIIYYAIAQVELDMKNDSAAAIMLKKSIYYNTEENPEQRSKSFLLLADINYNDSKYVDSKNFYDSVETSSITDEQDLKRIDLRKEALTIIAADVIVINREDSLREVAALPKDKRDALIKKTVRSLRKQKGLSEEPELSINPAVQQPQPADLFNANTSASNKDWYFNNLQLKSSGANQFRATWGNRPNADNWRRLAGIKQEKAGDDQKDDNDTDTGDDSTEVVANTGEPLLTDSTGEITYESLLALLPLTDEQMKASNEKIADALFLNGQAFQDKLEDYPAAIKTYIELLEKYPDTKNKEQALFNLYYCYNKTGDKAGAAAVAGTLSKNFPEGDFTAKIKNARKNAEKQSDPATAKYKEIYDLFVSGEFEKAEAAKVIADSTYGNSYWTPQLLYIESIYYVSKRDDSTAIEKLTNLQNMYAQTPLAEKAATMIDVLGRRKEIENYLTNLDIKRYQEDAGPVVNLETPKTVFEKVDTKRDSLVSKPVTQIAKSNVDTTNKVAAPVIKSYEFNAKDPQYVVVLLDKVAPVFVSEAKNAFNKYNQVNFYNQKLNITPVPLDERYNLVLIGPFTDAAVAVEYVDKVKPVTGSRIIPWLTPDKYTYSIISESNLAIMKEIKDVDSYKKLIDKVLPGKF